MAQKVTQLDKSLTARMLNRDLYEPFNPDHPEAGGYQVIEGWEKGTGEKGVACTLVLTYNEKRRRRDKAILDAWRAIVESKMARGEKLGPRKTGWAAGHGGDQERAALLKSRTLQLFKPPQGEPGACALERDHDAINAASRYFGLFASVSTMPCDAQSAIETSRNRDCIEKCFKAGKSGIGMAAIRSHSDAAMTGRFIVSFCALTILCELRRRMQQPFLERSENGEIRKSLAPLADEMSFNALLNHLDSVKVSYGNAPEETRYEEVTGRQRLIARRLGCNGVFDRVPDYAMSCAEA